MEINTRQESGVIVIIPEGEIDISVTDSLRDKLKGLTDEKRMAILIDMSAVPYIDSSGLGVLVEAMQEMGKYGAELKLAHLTDDVKKVFELTRLNKFFTIFGRESDALDSFKK